MILPEQRRFLFDWLCTKSSPDFVKYLRAYENLVPQPPEESFTVSCELVNGKRMDNMRLGIACFRQKEALSLASICQLKEVLIPDVFFRNSPEGNFGIGLADYAPGRGISRAKVYNTYGSSESREDKFVNIRQLFSLLDVPDHGFTEDCAQFKDIVRSGVDWDSQGSPGIKVYFGFFHRDLSQRFWHSPSIESVCYEALRKRLLPERFMVSVRYSKESRWQKTVWECKTRRMIVPYLKMFDHDREASRFFVDLYKIAPRVILDYISVQEHMDGKIQVYFRIS